MATPLITIIAVVVSFKFSFVPQNEITHCEGRETTHYRPSVNEENFSHGSP